ncbi:MAG: glycerol-3-phosphate 1-O-acyltransferase PlsY [bacterium]
MTIFVIAAASFLCGSIPTGYILVKHYRGIDIRKEGSGNIGSTNVKRIAGRKIAFFTQLIDILKGTIPTCVVFLLFSSSIIMPFVAAFCAIAGHCFTPFLGFRGGKGVNTTIGGFIVVAPVCTLISIGVYFLFRLTTHIVSVGSIAFALSLALCITVSSYPSSPYPIIFAISVSLLIIGKHKDNIVRIIRGQEKRTSY